MTLRRLRLIAALTPILAVVVLDLARYLVVGNVAWQQRLLLDVVAVAAIVLFTAIIFRFVGDMHGRLQRQNQELLALHTAVLDVTADLSLDVVLKKVVEQAKNLVGAKYGAL